MINDKIDKACELYEQKPRKVNLLAVTKAVAAEKILFAIEAGVKIFGENYLQEAEEKWPEIKKKFPQIQLHFIGHLQSNKVKQVVEIFDCIEVLDSKKLALALQKEIKKQQKNPEIFIQVNLGEETQKSGVLPVDLADLVKFSREECSLKVTGLMGIPPSNQSASPYFALLAKLAKENNIKNLSMGMSADFEEGIAMGASHIRLGSAIFGERQISN